MRLTTSRFVKSILCGAVASLVGFAFAPQRAQAATVDLGDAGNYAVFALDQFQYNGPGVINGDVAVGGSTNFAAPAQINGTVFLNTGVPQQGNIVPTGGFQTVDLSQAISDAKSAANTLAGLTSTQNLGTIGNNVTITGNGGVNVISTSGINMSNGQLVLKGGANDIFIINDSGQFQSSNSDMSLQGGVTANHIVFNVKGSVAITGGGGNEFDGTILAPTSSVAVHDKTLNGEIIGGEIADTSGFTVNHMRAVPGPSPLLATFALVSVMGVGYVVKRRGAEATA